MKHLVGRRELVNKRGWRLDQKGLTYNGTWAKKGVNYPTGQKWQNTVLLKLSPSAQ